MNFIHKTSLVLIILVLILVGVANACSIDVDNLQVEVKVDGSYSSTITAMIDDDIDAKMTFDITDYSGSDCPNDINTKLVITRYNDTDNNWEAFQTSAIKIDALDEDDYTFSWSNEFTVDDDSDYTKYKVEGIVFYDNNGVYTELDNDSATVNVEGESCDSIKLNVNDITIDESDTTTKTFSIENTSNLDFEITDISVDLPSSKLELDDLEYNDTVSNDSEEDIDISINADSVSGDYETSGTISVSGYLGSEYCSENDIGDEDFDITISETDEDYSGDEDCKDIVIIPRDFTMEETTNSKVAFSVQNNSTKRFELTGVEVTSNGLNLSNYYFGQYIFSGQVSDLILNATAPAVTQDRTYNNTIKVKGMFYTGKECSFSDIYSKTFNTTIKDVEGYSISPSSNCGALTISAPAYVSVENYGTFSLTVVNSTNKRADIYVEGSVDAQPTLISIPTNTSITREVSFGISASTGEINFRPVVEGCSLNTTRVGITNTAAGSIKNTSISTTVIKDENTEVLTLSITIENNTNKVFNGIVEATASGYNSVDKSISASPGKNVLELKLIPNGQTKSTNGTVTFKANGEEKSTQFDTKNDSSAFAGLFLFGPISGTLGLLLIIIIVVLVIASVVLSRTPRKEDTDQEWVENKE